LKPAALAWLVASGFQIDSVWFRLKKAVNQSFDASLFTMQLGGNFTALAAANSETNKEKVAF
jgi:hypothetical protein